MAQERYLQSSSLVEVVDRILDKGIVIDAWISISVIGIELLTVEARVIVASVETYVKYAGALGYIGPIAAGLNQQSQRKSLGEGVADLTRGLGKGAKNVQEVTQSLPQSIPAVGNVGRKAETVTSGRGRKRKTTAKSSSRKINARTKSKRGRKK